MVIIFLISSIFINWNFSVRKMCLFLSFIYSIIYIRLDSWIFILFFGLWCNTIIIYFIDQSVLALVIGSYSILVLCPFDMHPFFSPYFLQPETSALGALRPNHLSQRAGPIFFFLSSSLLFGTTSASGSSCYFLWHTPSHSSKEPWFLLLKTKI